MVTQSAGVVGRGDKVGTQSVHLGKRCYHAGVAEVIDELASGEGGTGGRLNGNEAVVPLTSEHLTHEGGYKSAQVGTAAGTADDDIGYYAVFIHGNLGLKADNGLVEQNLVENAAQNIAVAGSGGGCFNGFGNGAAQRAGGSGMLLQYLPSHFGGHRWGGGDAGAVSTHYFTTEGLLLIGALDHIYLAVQAQIGAGHGQGSAPLTGTGLGSDTLQTLVLGVIGLGDGGVQLVGAGGVVAFKLVVDLGRGLELLLQAVGADQGGGTVHFVEVQYLLGNGNVRCVVVQFLFHQLVTEHCAKLLGGHRLESTGIKEGGGLVFHVGPDVVPGLGHLAFFQVDFVGDLVFAHFCFLLSLFY